MIVRIALAAATLAAAIPAMAQEADPATTVATVNGETITLGDLVAVRRELPQQVQQLPDEMLYDGIRSQLVDSRLAADAAEAAGLADEDRVAAALDRQRTALLADFYLQQLIAEEVTDERLQAVYQQTYVEADPVREVEASHILVQDEELARSLIEQLDDGADFAALAAEHGTDGTAQQGGNLGFFARDRMVPPFAEAAFAAEIGDNVGPVRTQFGWHVLRVTAERDQPVPPFAQVRGDIRNEVVQEVVQARLGDLRDAAEVSVAEDRPGLDALRDDSLID
jgi:peptidyl-prolyl cis-trans isomerase C